MNNTTALRAFALVLLLIFLAGQAVAACTASAGAPTSVDNASNSQPVASVTVGDNGSAPLCFQTAAFIRITYGGVLTTSPTLQILDPSGLAGLIVTMSTTYAFAAGSPQTVVTIAVQQAGSAGSSITLSNATIDGTTFADHATVTAVVSTLSGFVAPLTVGTAVQRGPLTSNVASLSAPGQVQVGVTSTLGTVSVKNSGSATVTIASITPSGDFSQQNACGGALAPNATCTVTLLFAPTAPGLRSGSLVVTHNGKNSPLSVSLSGTGAAPAQPVVSSIKPPLSYAGLKGLEFLVFGTNFSTNSVVAWDSTPLVTKYVNSTTLDAFATSAQLALTGTPAITVSTPGAATSVPFAYKLIDSPLPSSRYKQYLPHMVMGAGFATKITIVNPSNAPANVVLSFVSQSGVRTNSTSVSIPANGTYRYATAEASRFGASQTQWVIVGSDAPVLTNLFFELADNTGKQILNTVGFSGAAPLTEMSIPVEFDGSGTTWGRTVGIALANASVEPSYVTMALVDSTGVTRGTYQFSLDSYNQKAIDLSTLNEFAQALLSGKFMGTLAIHASQPTSVVGLGDDFGPFSATPVRYGRAIAKVDDAVRPCPSAAEIATFNADLQLSFEADDTAPALVCYGYNGSADLTFMQERSYQALRAMKLMEFDTQLPFSSRSNLYEWLASNIKGIRFRGDITSSDCCDPSGVINIRMQSNYSSALLTTRWIGSASSGLGTGLDGLVEVIVHEARHVQSGGHTCGGFDQTISELGAIGSASYYSKEWQNYRSASFLDDVDANEAIDRYRTLAWSEASATRDNRTAICTLEAVFAAPKSYDFGSQPVQNIASLRDIAITAGSSSPTPITGATIATLDPKDFSINGNTCAAKIPPPTCIITVAFSPYTTGSKTATLTVNHSISGTPPITVALSGTGIAASPLPSQRHQYLLPHIVTGGGFVTKITINDLSNIGGQIWVHFIGQDGTLLESKPYNLSPGGTLRLSTAEADRFGASTTKWAVVGTQHPAAVNLFFELQDSNKNVINTIGFNDSSVVTSFTVPIEFEPDTHGGMARTFGIALANPGAKDAIATLNLFDANGTKIASTVMNIPAYGQVASDLGSVTAIRAALPNQNMVGSLAVSANVPLAAIGLIDDLGPFSAVPIAP